MFLIQLKKQIRKEINRLLRRGILFIQIKK